MKLYAEDIVNFSQIITGIGLGLDIVGAVPLFFFGLPPIVDPDGHIRLILEQEDREEKAKAEVYKQRGNLGMIQITIGFILQFIGLFV